MSFLKPPTPPSVPVAPPEPTAAPQLQAANQKPQRKGMTPTVLSGLTPTQQQAPGRTLLGGTTT